MRLVDADTLKRKAQKLSIEAWKINRVAKVTQILNQFIDWIEGMPTIDAVEVVRCRDCKNRAKHVVCHFLGEDGFCSYGERREDGEAK